MCFSMSRSNASSNFLCTLAAKAFPVLRDSHVLAIFLRPFIATTRTRTTNMATHMVKVREDLLQKLITLSQETGKPMSDLIEEVLDWARQQSQVRQRQKTG